MRPSRHAVVIFVIAWALALALSFALDQRVAEWVRDAVPVNKHVHRTQVMLIILKLPGWFPFTLAIAVMVGLFHRRHWLGAIALALNGICVGAIYNVIKWVAGRHRPVIKIDPRGFHPFPRGISGIWREQGLCFPSGHTLLAFATAMCLSILLPKWAWLFFIIALVTAAERVLENAHYLSDVMAGAGLGMGVGWWITHAVLGLLLTNEIANPDAFTRNQTSLS